MTQPRFTSRGRCIALVVATGLFLGGLAPSATLAVESTDPRAEAPDESLGSNAGWGVAAFVGNLVYAPVKLLVALGGTLAGGVAWAVTGGDGEQADAIIRPSLTGDYVLTPDHLRGFDDLELLGGTRSLDDRYYAGEVVLPPVGAGLPVPPTCEALPSLRPLYFDLDESELGDESQRVLREVASTLSTCPDRSFRLEGHADAQGEGPYNFTLSLRRATAVKTFLVEEGIEEKRLEAAGLGEGDPASSNDNAEGRALNRRVELRDGAAR